jgi:putative cell wall-binding protein
VAGTAGVPVLLTPPHYLPAEVAAELRRLDPAMIFIAGGPASVSEEVRAAISALWESP